MAWRHYNTDGRGLGGLATRGRFIVDVGLTFGDCI